MRLINGEPLRSDLEAWLPATVPAGTLVVPGSRIASTSPGAARGGGAAAGGPADLAGAELRAAAGGRGGSLTQHGSARRGGAGGAGPAGTAGRRIPISTFPRRPSGVKRPRAPGWPASIRRASSISAVRGQDQVAGADGRTPRRAAVRGDSLILTDGSGYELGPGNVDVCSNVPVWMVHLGGDIPLGYDDGTLGMSRAAEAG